MVVRDRFAVWVILYRSGLSGGEEAAVTHVVSNSGAGYANTRVGGREGLRGVDRRQLSGLLRLRNICIYENSISEVRSRSQAIASVRLHTVTAILGIRVNRLFTRRWRGAVTTDTGWGYHTLLGVSCTRHFC